MTQAIILAAGRGSRMKHLTETLPKCLTTISDRSLLEWQIDSLNKSGLQEINIVCGYKNHLLEGSFNKLINENWASTNMVMSLFEARDILRKDSCIISYSDIVYHPQIVQDLLADDSGFSISYDLLWEHLWRVRFEDPLSDAESFETNDGKLLSIGEKVDRIEEIQGQYMGL